MHVQLKLSSIAPTEDIGQNRIAINNIVKAIPYFLMAKDTTYWYNV